MNVARIALASVAAFIAYFAIGFLAFGMGPLRKEFENYKTIYRSEDGMKAVMPIGMLAMLLAMVVLTILYASMSHGGSGLAAGARFGALIGLFAVCAFVLHNYVNLNIGLRLTIGQAVAYFVEWVVVGIVIGAIYQPVAG
jgi:hypothetical protein